LHKLRGDNPAQNPVLRAPPAQQAPPVRLLPLLVVRMAK
jgi:hypothetical protein